MKISNATKASVWYGRAVFGFSVGLAFVLYVPVRVGLVSMRTLEKFFDEK